MAVVFLIKIIKTSSIFYSLTLGLIEAEIKGILWIFFI
jgi:hypothetical protein